MTECARAADVLCRWGDVRLTVRTATRCLITRRRFGFVITGGYVQDWDNVVSIGLAVDWAVRVRT